MLLGLCMRLIQLSSLRRPCAQHVYS
ncbi:hypothetical protein Gohar_002978, partial [Gossypium harknessii]|nr:hypothetical protein [Gossypium harknessii]